jgi:hypothetical protein
VIGTLIVAATTCVYLILTTKEDAVRREGLFGGVYFQSSQNPSGSLTVTLGVGNWWGLGIVFCGFLVLSAVFFVMYRRITEYKKGLQTERMPVPGP